MTSNFLMQSDTPKWKSKDALKYEIEVHPTLDITYIWTYSSKLGEKDKTFKVSAKVYL